jgi:hypothetical protein
VRLLDPFQSAPRVHTNHPLHEEITRWASHVGEQTSKSRLESIASHAIDATCCSPAMIAGWFGFDDREGSHHTRFIADTGVSPETTVLAIIDPAERTLSLRRGGKAARLESVKL